MGINVRRLERRARRQPREADLVVAVSASLVTSLTSDGVEPLFVPNGCDVDAYRSTSAPAEGAPPVVAFVGHLSERVDVTLLEAVARTGVQLLFVGARQTTIELGSLRLDLCSSQRAVAGGSAVLVATRGAVAGHHLCAAVQRLRLQPRELSPEGAGVPRGRSAGRLHGPAGRAVAGHESRSRSRRGADDFARRSRGHWRRRWPMPRSTSAGRSPHAQLGEPREDPRVRSGAGGRHGCHAGNGARWTRQGHRAMRIVIFPNALGHRGQPAQRRRPRRADARARSRRRGVRPPGGTCSSTGSARRACRSSRRRCGPGSGRRPRR